MEHSNRYRRLRRMAMTLSPCNILLKLKNTISWWFAPNEANELLFNGGLDTALRMPNTRILEEPTQNNGIIGGTLPRRIPETRLNRSEDIILDNRPDNIGELDNQPDNMIELDNQPENRNELENQQHNMNELDNQPENRNEIENQQHNMNELNNHQDNMGEIDIQPATQNELDNQQENMDDATNSITRPTAIPQPRISLQRRCQLSNAKKKDIRTSPRLTRRTGENTPITAARCLRSSTSRGTMHENNEVRQNSLDELFQCSTCNVTFLSKRSLSGHKGYHALVQQLVCEDCGKGGFQTKSSLRQHRRARHHRVRCLNCGL